MKVKANEYSQLKTQVGQMHRKTTGSLAFRDVSELVDRSSLVETDFMTTMLVAVPKSSAKQWWSHYEWLADYVVPRSSKQVTEDSDYILVTAVIFQRSLDQFKHACREYGFQPRDHHSGDSDQSHSEQREQLERNFESKRSELEEWCRTSYGEAFTAQLHLYAIRLFVESILRYGLPPSFLSVLLLPHKKAEKKLRQVLASNFGQSGSYYKNVEQDESSEDVYPYVSFNPTIHC